MRNVLLSAILILVATGSARCFAASPETNAFLSNVRINAFFLAQSSDLASDRSENGDLRAFAGGIAEAQKALVANLDVRSAPQVAQAMPITIAANEVRTGRSAAVTTDGPIGAYSAPAGSGAMMPAAMITLSHLAAGKGQAFDTLYKATQINALRQLAGLYNAYSMTGDDPSLRQMAKTELSATDDRIAALARL